MRKLANPDSPDSSLPVDKSLLGIFGAGEAQLLCSIVQWSGLSVQDLKARHWWDKDGGADAYDGAVAGRIYADPMNRKFKR